MRTCDHRTVRPFASSVTAIQRNSFATINGLRDGLSDEQWTQVSLPIRAGGCGIGDAESLAPVARLAGALQFAREAGPLLNMPPDIANGPLRDVALLEGLSRVMPPTLEPLATWIGTGRITMPAPDEQRQRWWGDRLTTARHDGLMRRATGRDIPRLESIRAGDCSGAWMTCVPSVMHNTLIPSSEYVLLIKWHMGIPQLPLEAQVSVAGRADGQSTHTVTMRSAVRTPGFTRGT